jgi:hypothetical protein
LPSGKRVTVRANAKAAAKPTKRDESAWFHDVIALFDDNVLAIEQGKTRIDVRDLALRDFHVLRAVLTKAGLVNEDEVEIDCHNCGAILIAHPCEGLETGPWEDGEATDPELDKTADFDVPLAIAVPIALGRVREARTVTLRDRSVRDAMPLFQALSKDPLDDIDAPFVEAMGIAALGAINDPKRIARALAECDEDSFAAVTDVFLEAHYPLRLASDVFCTKCKARNTVDAPHDREFELGPTPPPPPPPPPHSTQLDPNAEPEHFTPLPKLEDFVDLAHAIADPLIAEIPGEKAELIVEDGTPAVDDGGEPLLGSYVPPPPKDAPVPMQPPTVTVYYRTFEKIEREDGPFDWEDELRETIEHELEHHIFYLRGDDPMDEEEHAEIDREIVRVVGRNEATRRTLAVFGLSVPDFFKRAWIFVFIGAAALAISLAEGRCTAVD